MFLEVVVGVKKGSVESNALDSMRWFKRIGKGLNAGLQETKGGDNVLEEVVEVWVVLSSAALGDILDVEEDVVDVGGEAGRCECH